MRLMPALAALAAPAAALSTTSDDVHVTVDVAVGTAKRSLTFEERFAVAVEVADKRSPPGADPPFLIFAQVHPRDPVHRFTFAGEQGVVAC